MFDGFELATIETAGASIRVRHGGSGPPLLLLHGHPQTHVMWHRVAPRLAERFTIVAPDLRGYGDSSKPPTTDDHEPYSKRVMAQDQVELMAALGFERFGVAGHDRGGRVGYRLALDHPERVARLAVLNIVPTGELLSRLDLPLARDFWHWFFLAQPEPLPERLIGADPDTFYLRVDRAIFAPEALAAYRRAFTDPATIHAMCEDYRAALAIDGPLDLEDRGKRRIECPVLALWGEREQLGRSLDVLAIWREWADDVSGRALRAGHYLAEEAPDETFTALNDFFAHMTV